MNTQTLIASVVVTLGAFAVTSSAIAADARPGYPQPYATDLTRAEVKAETLHASEMLALPAGERNVVVGNFASTKTRAQVHAETLEAIRVGAISHGELNAVPTTRQLDSIRMAGERAIGNRVAKR